MVDLHPAAPGPSAADPASAAGVVETPVRVAHIIGADGRVRRSLRVFCWRNAASVALARCAECDHRVAITEASDRSGLVLICRMVDGPDPPGLPPELVGPSMSREVICAEPDARLAQVHAALPVNLDVIAVIHDDGRLLGVVNGERHLHDPIALRTPVRELMAGAPITVEETTSLEAAVRVMAVERKRRLPVVNGGQLVVGVLQDVEAMHRLFQRRPG